MGVVLVVLVIWAIWASLSTGGLQELKQINPEYAHPDKSVAYLVSKLEYSESNGFWDKVHVSQCSFYMPNWSKAEACVKARLSCELTSPKRKDTLFGKDVTDIYSDEFDSCWLDNRPFFGPFEWLRFSRALWRFSVSFGGIWLTGGWDKKGEEYAKWEEENKWWVKPATAWVSEGE